MPVPTLISDLSTTAASNYPQGSDSPATLDDTQRAHGAFIAQLRDGKGFANAVTVASATTTDIGGQSSQFVEISGTTTITSLGSNYNGPRFLRFTGILTLTHNATSLNIPGSANITTTVGGTCIATPNVALNGWNIFNYAHASGLAPGLAASSGSSLVGYLPAGAGAVPTTVQAKLRKTWVDPYIEYGADPTGVADSSAAFLAAIATGRTLDPSSGTYALNIAPTTPFHLIGGGADKVILKPFVGVTAIINYRAGNQWQYAAVVEGVKMLGTAKAGVGITFGQTVPGNYVEGYQYYNNMTVRNVRFEALAKGFQTPYGNIGCALENCDFTGNFYGIYALNNKWNTGAGKMHSGDKQVRGGQLDSNDCAVYVHDTNGDGFGGWVFDSNVIFELNNINGYFYSLAVNNNPLTFNQTWIENGGSLLGGSTSLDQWSGTTLTTSAFTNRGWIFDGENQVVDFNGCGIVGDIDLRSAHSKVRINGGRVELNTDFGGYGVNTLTVAQSTSGIEITNPTSEGGNIVQSNVIVKGRVHGKNADLTAIGATQRRHWKTSHRLNKVAGLQDLTAQNFTAAVNTTGLIINGTVVTSSPLFAAANTYVDTGAHAGQFAHFPGTSRALTAGNFVVVTFMVVWTAGTDKPQFFYGDLSANQTFAFVDPPVGGGAQWHTFASLAQVVNTAAQGLSYGGAATGCTFSISAFQVAEFRTMQEAQVFLDAGIYGG